jgi:hypothetical protein
MHECSGVGESRCYMLQLLCVTDAVQSARVPEENIRNVTGWQEK